MASKRRKAPEGLRDPVDFTKNGQCSRCGSCCSSLLPLDFEEAKKLKDYVRDNKIVPHAIPEGDDVAYLQCPFLEKSGKPAKASCLVYDARPAICRIFSCGRKVMNNAAEWQAAFPDTPVPPARNMWLLFNRTGIRKGGEEIPYDKAPLCRIGTDDGAEYQFQIGRPASFALEGNEYIPPVIVVDIYKNGIQAPDPKTGTLRFYPFDKMTSVLLDTCIVTPPGGDKAEKEDGNA